MFKDSKVLVAGGTGFIGVNLINRLVTLGANIRATLYKRPPIIMHDLVHYIQADLTKMEDCKRAVDGMDYVFMCAANTSGAAVMTENPLAHVTPNIVMNAQILEAAYLAHVKKFLFISSSAAYPPSGDRPVKEEEMFVGDPYDVYYSVGWMKRYTEILCKVYSQKVKNPMPIVVVRPSNVYGPYDKFDFKSSHMTAALIRRVVERQNPIVVWGSGNDVRDLIFIEDMVDGSLLAFERSDRYLAVNIASGNGYGIKDILMALLDLECYKNVSIEFDNSKPTTIPIRLIATDFARKELSFFAKTKLKDGLSATIKWYKENSKLWNK